MIFQVIMYYRLAWYSNTDLALSSRKKAAEQISDSISSITTFTFPWWLAMFVYYSPIDALATETETMYETMYYKIPSGDFSGDFGDWPRHSNTSTPPSWNITSWQFLSDMGQVNWPFNTFKIHSSACCQIFMPLNIIDMQYRWQSCYVWIKQLKT